jgi:hypothetical protein
MAAFSTTSPRSPPALAPAISCGARSRPSVRPLRAKTRCKHYGATVAVAGLLTGPQSPWERSKREAIVGTEVSGYGGGTLTRL